MSDLEFSQTGRDYGAAVLAVQLLILASTLVLDAVIADSCRIFCHWIFR